MSCEHYKNSGLQAAFSKTWAWLETGTGDKDTWYSGRVLKFLAATRTKNILQICECVIVNVFPFRKISYREKTLKKLCIAWCIKVKVDWHSERYLLLGEQVAWKMKRRLRAWVFFHAFDGEEGMGIKMLWKIWLRFILSPYKPLKKFSTTLENA